MPRDGALVLTDLRQPMLSVVCEPCGRRGRYSVAKLIEQHGDAKLTDLLQELAACPAESPLDMAAKIQIAERKRRKHGEEHAPTEQADRRSRFSG